MAMTVVTLIGSLSACSTTQQQNLRLRLKADRILTSQRSMRVTRPNPDVSVVGVALLSTSTGTAVSVTLRNDEPTPVSDLPISVGVRTSAGPDYFNRAAGLDYFQTHIGALAAGATTTWVFESMSIKNETGFPFAHVGHPALAADQFTLSPRWTPAITATLTGAIARVTNNSKFPQYDLTIYASALTGGRLLAAGVGSVPELDAGDSASVPVQLLGSAPHISLDVPATITD
jgi:hypothetical protein